MMRLILTIDEKASAEGLRCGLCGADKNLAMFALDVEQDGKIIRTVKDAVCGECFVKGMEARCPGFRESVNAPQGGRNAEEKPHDTDHAERR